MVLKCCAAYYTRNNIYLTKKKYNHNNNNNHNNNSNSHTPIQTPVRRRLCGNANVMSLLVSGRSPETVVTSSSLSPLAWKCIYIYIRGLE